MNSEKELELGTLFYSVCLILFGFLISLLSPLNPFSSLSPGTDSSVFLYIGKSMAEYGQLPYRDVFDHKGPLLYLINFIGFKVNGYLGVWFIEIILIVIDLLLIFFAAMIVTKNRLVSFATTIVVTLPLVRYFEGGNLTEEYALPFMLLSLLYFTKFIHSTSNHVPKLEVLIIGVCCGSVLLLRPNMIALWISFCFSLVVFFLFKKRIVHLLQCVGLFLLGNLFMIVPFIFFYDQHGALTELLNAYLVFNYSYTDTSGDLNSLLDVIVYFWETSAFISIALLLCMAEVFKNRNLQGYLIYGSCGLFLVSSLILLSISGRTYDHYGMVLIPCFVIPIAKFIEILNNQFKGSFLRKLSFNCILIGLLSFPSIVIGDEKIADTNTATLDVKTQKIVTYIQEHTEQDEQISVIGNKVSFYLLSDRPSASKYIYQTRADVSNEILEGYLNDLEQNRPQLLIYIVPGSIVSGSYQEQIRNYLDTLVVEEKYKLNESITPGIWVYEKIS